jgi:hypothetical protein
MGEELEDAEIEIAEYEFNADAIDIVPGFDEDENEAWNAVAYAASVCLHLEPTHPMEKEELAHAFHIIQNYLLARPTYKAYVASVEAKETQNGSEEQND